MEKIIDISLHRMMNPNEGRAPTYSGSKESSLDSWERWCELEGVAKCFRDATPQSVSKFQPAIALEQIKNWLHKENRRTLFLWGGVGSGKTYTAFSICRYLFEIKKELNIKYLPSSKIIELGKTEMGLYKLKHSYGDCNYLFVDDLGVEGAAEWEIKHIFTLFDCRYGNNLSTIVTSNLSLEGIKDKLTERISSRLVGDCIKFPDDDLRELNK